MRTLGVVFASVLAACLSSCYTSEIRLITPSEADYPLASPLYYRMQSPQNSASNNYGTLTRERDEYVKVRGMDGDVTHVLFRHIDMGVGDNFYIAQESGSSNLSTYDLARIERDAVHLYNFRCDPERDSQALSDGRLTPSAGSGIHAPCAICQAWNRSCATALRSMILPSLSIISR